MSDQMEQNKQTWSIQSHDTRRDARPNIYTPVFRQMEKYVFVT